MAIPILKTWKNYFSNYDEGLGSSYERIILNNKIVEICAKFRVKSVLEAPSFGFTGLSGINSLQLAKSGCEITLFDHDKERIELIKSIWNEVNYPLKIEFSKNYNSLPFTDNHFDFSWNFSALWFVDNLQKFLSELTRTTEKAILICVPNRTGIGYLSQKFLGKQDLKKLLKEKNILPKNIQNEMHKLNWELVETNYIDVPWWPDIGMPKDKFAKILKLDWLLKKEKRKPISIMDFYKNKDNEFPEKMMKHFWFEKFAPKIIKKIWAHHKYFLFVPKK
ncbi:MAG: methyltransferase domain-containing protein [Candidatus Cloacimonetes bacterium]|jgi:hypothetical protein|nr:methyltransferase domain-containing protein [Candidatus Cloacimonadota bacterium]MBT6994074.1 methyltransferase domain-containing protein [Candidatus Cloacimonadota bacterium]MBT7469599.1 methyltransferase domain-containing protein [Candidatus Cloacimonadota bacterium]